LLSVDDYGAVVIYIDGNPVDVALEFTADATGTASIPLPIASDVQIGFYYYTSGDWQWYFSIDNFNINTSLLVIDAIGDALAWFFEDDAETGGNPLWTN
jgi:hypothetical protein